MTGIYLRRSVEKKDSISLEYQEERCRMKLTSDEECAVYTDNGISGKSTENRPDFQRMMTDVRKGIITKIIIYKFDRISRSLLDFVTMQSEFEKYHVELVSCEENFDTSTPMGKVIVNILMMFAEMERETIEKRITDNYYARGAKGFYLGGYAPFGTIKLKRMLTAKRHIHLRKIKMKVPFCKRCIRTILTVEA